MTASVMIAFLTFAAVHSDSENPCTLASVDRARTLSSTCLSCHDGSAAPGIALHVATGKGSHPVAVNYRDGRRDVSLYPSGPLDPMVVLPAGRVECTTCHDARGTGAHKTVTEFSALCTGCHQK